MQNNIPDFITTIYLVKGFLSNDENFEKSRLFMSQNENLGEFEMMDRVAQCTSLVDQVYEENPDSIEDVFAYTVAEPVGFWLCEWIAKNETFPCDQDIKQAALAQIS